MEVDCRLVRMEWRPAGLSVCLPLLISLCTIKSRRKFLLAPAHPGGPGKRAIKRLCVSVRVTHQVNPERRQDRHSQISNTSTSIHKHCIITYCHLWWTDRRSHNKSFIRGLIGRQRIQASVPSAEVSGQWGPVTESLAGITTGIQSYKNTASITTQSQRFKTLTQLLQTGGCVYARYK